MPKYTKSAAQGDWGEYYFAYKVIKTFGWPCRILDIDIGIDAQIEILDKEFNTTGRFIGVQIKTADKLQITDRHIKYWRSCEFPIIIVHISPKTKKMSYLHVDKTSPKEKFRSLDNFKIFDANQTDALRELTFNDVIGKSKFFHEKISSKLHHIGQETNSDSEHYIDLEICDGFMSDLDRLRDELIEYRTIILPIYKVVNDCGYSEVLKLYSDTREQVIRCMKAFPYREHDQNNIKVFERASDFDLALELPI